jgi:hypothetical protein
MGKNPAKILKAFNVSELVLSRKRLECLLVDRRGVIVSSHGKRQFGYSVTMTKARSLAKRSKYCFLEERLGARGSAAS